MTRKDAIKKLKDILEEATETDDAVCYVTADDADALKMAINSLEIDEQYELEYEQAEPKTDMLDKIRAEIMEDIDNVQKDLIEELDQGIDIGLQMALDTINKYIVESEAKE